MSEITLNLSDYKSSGVYFLEIDNSIVQGGVANAAYRIGVGYNEKGPFNRPIYISSVADCEKLLGPVDRKLERRGCYTNRNIRTMAAKAPVYALNLLNVNTVNSEENPDKTSAVNISFGVDVSAKNDESTPLFVDMFDRTKFWIADAGAMVDNINYKKTTAKYPFTIGNCGTKDVSLIIRRATGLKGYGVTFLEWFGNKEEIPYKWIAPTDYVEDYFYQVIAVSGIYTDYATYANEPKWKDYFSENGLKADKLELFLKAAGVEIVGNWTGCIIPDFYNKQGMCVSLEYQINKTSNVSGLLFGVNNELLDNLELQYATEEEGGAKFLVDGEDLDIEKHVPIDVNGVCMEPLEGDASATVDVLSYSYDNNDLKKLVFGSAAYSSAFINNIKNAEGTQGCQDIIGAEGAEGLGVDDPCKFILNDDIVRNTASGDAPKELPVVGDLVRAADGTMTRITRREILAAVPHAAVAAVEPDGDNEGTPGIEAYTETIWVYTTASPFKKGSTASLSMVYATENDPNIADLPAESYPENNDNQDFNVYGEDVFGADGSVNIFAVEIHKSLFNYCTALKFLPLRGFKITNRHRPGYDSNGNLDFEGGIEKIYKMLLDSGIRKGILNNETIDFRYIVDTMGGGLGVSTASKKILAELAQEKGGCTALINMPSMTDFANSTTPTFCDTFDNTQSGKPAFNVKYIAEGGNFENIVTGINANDSTEAFSLPTEQEGAKFAAYFAPYFKYKEGVRSVLIPPAADVCNTFVNKFLGGDRYRTVANLNGIIRNSDIQGLEYDFDVTDRDALEPFGVNPIISRNGVNMIYGDRTAYQKINSDFNFLHVRELLNLIEYECRGILNDYPFTYNNATTRAEIATRLDPILRAKKDSGALAKYEIQIDETNNTKEIIDQKVCIVDIGVWITPNMEKIITRLTVNRGSMA